MLLKKNIYYYYHYNVENSWAEFFHVSLMNRKFRRTAFIWNRNLCNIRNVYIITFDQFKASLLNKSINFYHSIISFDLWIFLFIKESCKMYSTVLNIDDDNIIIVSVTANIYIYIYNVCVYIYIGLGDMSKNSYLGIFWLIMRYISRINPILYLD